MKFEIELAMTAAMVGEAADAGREHGACRGVQTLRAQPVRKNRVREAQNQKRRTRNSWDTSEDKPI
jgi:hypothetical protein